MRATSSADCTRFNKGRHDWGKEKEQIQKAKIKAITVAEWLDRYLDLVKNMASAGTKKAQCIHLKRNASWAIYRFPTSQRSGYSSTKTAGLPNRSSVMAKQLRELASWAAPSIAK
jgi:hypothetical protein